MRLTPTTAEAAFDSVAFRRDSVAFRRDLDAVLTKHGVSFRLMKVHGATKLQARFDRFPTLALTMIELPATAPKGATRGYMRLDQS